MKKNFISLIALLVCMALFTSCEEDIEKRQVVFTATMPSDDLSTLRPGSIINGVPAADGFNLNAQWKDGDKIQLFVRQDGKVYQAESPAVVSDISSDGKTCSFQVTLPKSVNRDKGYDIIGVTGVESIFINGSSVIASCPLSRTGINSSDPVLLPMWFTAKKGSNQMKFRHMCVYEVLNVNNVSDVSITFKHAGFDAKDPWYWNLARILLSDGYRTAVDAGPNDTESNEITIPAGGSGTIVSWYIPAKATTEATINNAKLKAVVNGNAVTTIDALKSYKTFTHGNAYYMEVNWDGSTLYYSNEFCPDGKHPHMIDLGLPSGTKWACCNVGANSPAECGDYFAWGETAPKSYFGASNYKWYRGGDDHNITKYSSNSNYGVVDNIIGLQLEDDAAYVNWGAEWRMPGTAQMDEMMENCTSDWIKVNGMGGYLLKSNTNNAAIFFPAGGWYNSNGHKGFESDGTYWSRFNAYSTMPNLALLLSFRFGNMGWINVTAFGRQYGANVRAVHVE